MKKIKVKGIRNEKNYICLKLEKKQRLLDSLKNILDELGLRLEYNLFYEDVEERKKSDINKITDLHVRAFNKKYDLDLFFGKKRVMLVFRTKYKKKILNLIYKYFEWGKG